MIFGRKCAKNTRALNDSSNNYTELKNIEKKISTVFGSNIALLYLFFYHSTKLYRESGGVLHFH